MEREETTLEEVYTRLLEGNFYEDYDWASGPALRVLSKTIERITIFCERVEKGEVRSKRTYAEFCEILGRLPE